MTMPTGTDQPGTSSSSAAAPVLSMVALGIVLSMGSGAGFSLVAAARATSVSRTSLFMPCLMTFCRLFTRVGRMLHGIILPSQRFPK